MNYIILHSKEELDIQKLKITDIIEYSCEICGKEASSQWRYFKKQDRLLCTSCLKGKYHSDTPLDSDRISTIGLSISGKQKIQFSCLNCGHLSIVEFRHYTEDICPHCKQIKNNKSNLESTKSKARETHIKNYGENYRQLMSDRLKKSMLEKYGVESTMQSKDLKNKVFETQQRLFGGWALANTEIHEKTISVGKLKDSYVKGSYWHNLSEDELQDIIAKRNKRYTYQGIQFDSSWELAFYIYCIDHGYSISREPTYFEYTSIDGKPHKYVVDFLVNGVFYEVKSNYLMESLTKSFPEKLKCIMDNNVTIIGNKDIKKYIIYVEQTYGKLYLSQFRNY